MEFPTDIDNKIVRMLLQNARQSSEEIAKQLEVTSATVRRRVNRLIDDQALRIVALIDPEKFGFPIVAIIAFKVDRDKLDQTIQNLTQCPEIPWVTSTTGRYDVLTMAWFVRRIYRKAVSKKWEAKYWDYKKYLLQITEKP